MRSRTPGHASLPGKQQSGVNAAGRSTGQSATPSRLPLRSGAIRGSRRLRQDARSSPRRVRRMRTTATATSLLLCPRNQKSARHARTLLLLSWGGAPPAAARSCSLRLRKSSRSCRSSIKGGGERPTRPGRNATHHRASTRPRLCWLGSPLRMDKARGSRARRESQAFRLGHRRQVW
jgi:hypothetical protein